MNKIGSRGGLGGRFLAQAMKEEEDLPELVLPATVSQVFSYVHDWLSQAGQPLMKGNLANAIRQELGLSDIGLGFEDTVRKCGFITSKEGGSHHYIERSVHASTQIVWSEFQAADPQIVEGVRGKFPNMKFGVVFQIGEVGKEKADAFLAVIVHEQVGRIAIKAFKTADLMPKPLPVKAVINGKANGHGHAKANENFATV